MFLLAMCIFCGGLALISQQRQLALTSAALKRAHAELAGSEPLPDPSSRAPQVPAPCTPSMLHAQQDEGATVTTTTAPSSDSQPRHVQAASTGSHPNQLSSAPPWLSQPVTAMSGPWRADHPMYQRKGAASSDHHIRHAEPNTCAGLPEPPRIFIGVFVSGLSGLLYWTVLHSTAWQWCTALRGPLMDQC